MTTTIVYEHGYLRIEQAGLEIGFRVHDLKPDDRDALLRAAVDTAHARSAPKDPGLEELAKMMGMSI